MLSRVARTLCFLALASLGVACLALWVASFWYVAGRSLQRTTAHRGTTRSLNWSVAVFPNRFEAHHFSSEHVVTTQLNPMLADRPPKVLEASGGGIERIRPAARFADEPWRKPWPVWQRVEQMGGGAHHVSVPLA